MRKLNEENGYWCGNWGWLKIVKSSYNISRKGTVHIMGGRLSDGYGLKNML
jgi:hypothetical protein